MTRREWIAPAVLGAVLLGAAVLVGVTTDRLILHGVVSAPPQRLAAAMGGLFAGGLVFFAGLITWFIRRGAQE